jgi:hypothetical protein
MAASSAYAGVSIAVSMHDGLLRLLRLLRPLIRAQLIR